MAFAALQRHPRYRVSVSVDVVTGSMVEHLPLEDISLGGAFIKTAQPQPPKSALLVVLGGAPVRARVVHVLDEKQAAQNARAPGMGVEFENADHVRDAVLDLVDVQELVEEAAFLARVGQLEEAQEALLEARARSPGHDAVNAGLTAVNDEMDARRARDLLREAEAERRTAKIKRVRKATELSSSRDVLRKAMRLAASAGSSDDLVAIAEQLCAVDPNDELPLFALLHVHETAGRYADAARVGVALLRLRPDDLELHERVQAILGLAEDS